MGLRALAIGEEPDDAGFIGERAAAYGFEVVTVCRTARGEAPALDGFDLLLPLGSAWSVRDAPTHPWITGELRLIAEALGAGVPVLGICFGAQAMAAAAGGSVPPAPRPEIGWYGVDSDEPAAVPGGPWLQWHGDAIVPPPDARVVARSEVGVQAYRLGRSLGVQFHPEVQPHTVARWADHDRAELDRLGLSYDELLAETARRCPAARAAAHRLFDAFVAGAFPGAVPDAFADDAVEASPARP